ncbi:eukaryotic translation initiation factor eIF2A-domain-containing protein [Lipomyces kononenkoae]|uniref:Eukaryotic translation initiation factor eIF2A-domain-containing protein n=1 Tax=Lipomyces kononenkoae TaxID=34357 RepID=A0ACC3SUX8_LIPKO
MTPVPQFYFRTSKVIGLTNAAPLYEDVEGFQQPTGNLRTCIYSPAGGHFAYTTVDDVKVVDSTTGVVSQTIPLPNVYEVAFSPKGSYLCTYERPIKLDDGQNVHHNFKVWDVATGERVAQFMQKNQTMANFQFTYDEKFCARLVPNELQFYETKKLGGPAAYKLRVEGCTSFAIAPGHSYYIAVFVPERKGKPAVVDVYNAPNFSRPLSTKSIFKAERVVLKWNNLGTSLLVLTQTEVDQTGKSYYGESTLYLRGIAGNFDSRITLDKEGPIHDVAWCPDSKEFAVVYGYMPAKTMLFNYRGETVRTLPLGPRNTILYSPHGRFLILAGFGNLQGEVDIYDRQNSYNKVSTIDASNTSVCEWSPDGRYILFATTSPRLRVDNGVKVFHVTGKLAYVREMTELFSASWRPETPDMYPLRATISPAPESHESANGVEVKTPIKSAGAYRPPHARGSATPLLFKREDEGGFAVNAVDAAQQRVKATRTVPGAAPIDADAAGDEGLSKTALRNKKKREAKKAREATDAVAAAPETAKVPVATNGTATAPAAAAAAVPPPPPPGLGIIKNGLTFKNPQDEKKYRGLMKKLRAIEDLKMRQASGEQLEDTQHAKIKTEESVRSELAALGWNEK